MGHSFPLLSRAELTSATTSCQESLPPKGSNHNGDQLVNCLFARYSSLVIAASFKVLRDRAAAEDVCQDIFFMLWEHPKCVDTTRNLGAWFVVVSKRRSIDILRRKKKTVPVDDLQLLAESNVAAKAEQKQLLRRLYVAFSQLNLNERRLLILAFIDGLTHLEIAKHTGIPLGTVKSRIRCGLQKMHVFMM